ncbi:MAG TPA: AAA family ATPase [Stellaceae bacterium]|nr:AAA family ATPase [Stellaceae bacterium]
MNDLSTRTGFATETVSLSEAKSLIQALAHDQSIMLLSPAGLGKSDIVHQAAAEAGRECRALLGTQLAPEDVSGVAKIVGERSVFCPPRSLLPETAEPFCLFLDELPSCTPDVQKALSSLLLERRLGEHRLPPGTWVVAAGSRLEDRALVRPLSSALINRVFLLQLRLDVREWLVWARDARIHSDILAFIAFMPDALMRPAPLEPVPFSTPRAWASLSAALHLAEGAGIIDSTRRALAFARVSAGDAAIFCAMAETAVGEMRPPLDYLQRPELLPREEAARWFVLSAIRGLLARDGALPLDADSVNRFLGSLPASHRFALLIGLVEKWAALGADATLLA